MECKLNKESLLVNLRINQKYFDQLIEADVRFIRATTAREMRIIADHEAEAKALGRDAYRADRTDATGKKQPDSGTPAFGWNAEGRESVTLMRVVEDLEHLGLVLTDVHITQKLGDEKKKMYSLKLNFAKGEKARLVPEATNTINHLLRRTYGNLHAFRNPEGRPDTVNAVNIVQNPDETRVLRIGVTDAGNFSFRCE